MWGTFKLIILDPSDFLQTLIIIILVKVLFLYHCHGFSFLVTTVINGMQGYLAALIVILLHEETPFNMLINDFKI